MREDVALATKIVMPALGMQQDTGRLVAWLKDEGDLIAKGEPIMEIETDKAVVEIEAPDSGILGGVCAWAGDVVPVGHTVAWILAPEEAIPGGTPLAVGSEAPTASQQHSAPETTALDDGLCQRPAIQATPLARKLAEEYRVDLSQICDETRRVRQRDVLAYIEDRGSERSEARLLPASPKARRLAYERGLELTDLVGSGPGGAVLAADVPSADLTGKEAPAIELATAGGSALDPGGMWQVMVNRLTRSWTTTPQFYLVREVNATRLQSWRGKAQQWSGVKFTYSDLLVKLVASSLARHPRLNASWCDGRIVLHSEINVGLAVAVERGLAVPVLHKANELALEQIASRRQELVSRAMDGRLTPEDLAGGTFTVSNLGMYGVDMFNAVVNPPQAAILAVGRITERIVALKGQAVVQPQMVLSLTCDHRVVDGARAAEFLQTMVSFVEEPALLLA
jgi:pyruvate dehydrogenase E2 component (dihydrolipoamide acetyltransferase)